jgi:dihydroxy-acid dehydratase
VQDGDVIAIDVDGGTLAVELDDRELAERLARWKPPLPGYDSGVFARYGALVSSASRGAVLVAPPR